MRLAFNPPTLALALAALLFAQNCAAHPLAQGRMEVIIFPDHISLWARVSVEQVIVQQLLPTRDDEKVETQSAAYRAHGGYLLKHLFVQADGKMLDGKVVTITEPEAKAVHPLDAQNEFVTYEIEYPLAGQPALIELSQNVLNEVDFTPGNRWEATYVLGIRQDQKTGLENLLLTCKASLPFSCDWSAPPPAAPEKTDPKKMETPPARLNDSLEVPSKKTQFIVGALAGAALIYLVVALKKKRSA